MKILSNVIISVIIAGWMITLSVFSIQNITEVSLKVLIFESIKLPVGVLLSFCVGGGLILGAIAPILFLKPQSRQRRSSFRQSEIDDYFES
jgi:uncharacterized integral membrane protein